MDNGDFSVTLLPEKSDGDTIIFNKWLIEEWVPKHCKGEGEIYKNKFLSQKEAVSIILSKLCGFEITYEPIIFQLADFSSSESFAEAMSIISKHFKNKNIIVRYDKPENKKTHEVFPRFCVYKEEEKELN